MAKTINNKKISVVVSACLAGEFCRYDGKHKFNKKVFGLIESGRAIALCPELLAGLPVPRPAADVVNGRVIEKNGKDVTKIYEKGAQAALDLCKQLSIEKAMLKRGSPSCGQGGVFARLLEDNGIAVEYLDKT